MGSQDRVSAACSSVRSSKGRPGERNSPAPDSSTFTASGVIDFFKMSVTFATMLSKLQWVILTAAGTAVAVPRRPSLWRWMSVARPIRVKTANSAQQR